MRVALYYPWIYLKSGVERTILEVVRRSSHDFTIFTNHFDKKNTYPEFKNLKVIELKRVSVKRDLLSVLKAALIISFQKIDLADFGLLMVHSDGLGDLILLRNRETPAICYCHTPLRPVYDRFYRENAIKSRTFIARLFFVFFSYLFKKINTKLWQRYLIILFNSRETYRRANGGGLVIRKNDKNKYQILHPGVDTQKLTPSWVYKPYFFLPGRIMWTKNIELGIKSFMRFKKLDNRYSKFELIIAGQVDEKSRIYLQKLEDLSGNRKDIKFIISPFEEKIQKLYADCYCVLMTSFNEDFGITLLEGNAFGKPTIAINRGGPKESQINEVTGYLVNGNEECFVDAMRKFADDRKLLKKMGKLARRHSKMYDWNQFVTKFDQIIDNCF